MSLITFDGFGGFWRNLEIQDGRLGWPPFKNDDVISTSSDVISPVCCHQRKQFSTYYLSTTLHTVDEPAVRAAAKTILSCLFCQSFCSVTGSDLFRLYLNEVVIPILFCAGSREFKPIGGKYSSVDPISF